MRAKVASYAVEWLSNACIFAYCAMCSEPRSINTYATTHEPPQCQNTLMRTHRTGCGMQFRSGTNCGWWISHSQQYEVSTFWRTSTSQMACSKHDWECVALGLWCLCRTFDEIQNDRHVSYTHTHTEHINSRHTGDCVIVAHTIHDSYLWTVCVLVCSVFVYLFECNIALISQQRHGRVVINLYTRTAHCLRNESLA